MVIGDEERFRIKSRLGMRKKGKECLYTNSELHRISHGSSIIDIVRKVTTPDEEQAASLQDERYG